MSVPCVITAPAAPAATPAAADAIARAAADGASATPGTFEKSSTSNSATSAMDGTAASSSFAPTAGRAGDPVIAIVPPVATSFTRGSGMPRRKRVSFR